MGVKELLIGAVALGGVAGYAWDALPALWADGPTPAVPASSIDLREVPPTNADAEADDAWTAGSPPSAIEQSAYYSGCNEVRAIGKAPLHSGQPGYRIEMDGDGDGIACEPIRT